MSFKSWQVPCNATWQTRLIKITGNRRNYWPSDSFFVSNNLNWLPTKLPRSKPTEPEQKTNASGQLPSIFCPEFQPALFRMAN